jgi:hypothetical protein
VSRLAAVENLWASYLMDSESLGPGGQITAAQNCGINCAQIATVPMNSVIDTNDAASSMKIFNIAGLPRTQAPAFQISVSAIVPIGNCGFKIGSGSVNAWLKEDVPVGKHLRAFGSMDSGPM